MELNPRRLRFGGDYNPEQWPSEVWDEDVALMKQAGVTTATVAVFAWARLEPYPGEYDVAWLDDVLDRLHAGGVRVLLATATASPPVWLARDFPETLPVSADGVRLGFGSRQQYSPSSAVYREHALRLVQMLARRYGRHPAVEGWHVNNEYGCHVPFSYDEESAEAFRAWLRSRYGSVEELNRAWGTAFWSQLYSSFDQVAPPVAAPTFRNPTQLLDWDRFGSDALLALHRAELEVLRSVTPDLPVTTNFMGFFPHADYWRWAPHVDVVSDDSYPDPADPHAYVRLAAQRDLMRSLREGQPWLLMESAPSAVNWRPRNLPKPAGLHRVHSLQAVARGADGVLHFQWRQAAAGAEKFHSALVPHAGPDTRVFREVSALGAELAGLSDRVAGSRVQGRVAMVFDWDSWHALSQPAVVATTDYVETFLSWYAPFLRRGVTVDLLPRDAGADRLAGYDLVVAPALHVASHDDLAGLDAYVQGGGHLVVTYLSGVLDPDLHAWLGGYLGPLRETLGLRVTELAPAAGPLPLTGEVAGVAGEWNDAVEVSTAQVVAAYAEGFAAGGPAVTRHERGSGTAWYVGTQPSAGLLDELAARWLTEAGVPGLLTEPVEGVEAVVRGDLLFVLNHTGEAVEVPLAGGAVPVPGRDVLVRPV